MSTKLAGLVDKQELAYIAGVIDLMGIIRIRRAGETDLPAVFLHGPNTAMLKYLAERTGTKHTTVRRSYSKAGCAEHCQEKHQHVVSVSGRWSVTGAKATVLLWNIRPYLRLQAEAATSALNVGLNTPFKPWTLTKMADLGWDVPDLGPKDQAQ